MSYFLKKTNTKKGLYYQVYEGYYDQVTMNTKHTSVEVIGYHDELLKRGISDPLAYSKERVELYRKKERDEKKERITDDSPSKHYGYFLIDAFLKKLGIEKSLNLFQYGSRSSFKLYDVLRFLLIAQIIEPSSKLNEYSSLKFDLPNGDKLSYDQILKGLEELGIDYPSVITLINTHYDEIRKRNTGVTYFDCTNYYFEIDKPKEDKQKGPSKENRKEPIIGMGLLLDEDQLPLSMRIYPGNESEKPKIREILRSMKEEEHIKGRTIQIADKGLNCGQNIYEAIKNGDGYIYSQSVKNLPEKEKRWIELPSGYKEIYENGELIFKYKSCLDEFPYVFTHEGKKYTYNFKQKRVVYWSKDLEEKHRLEITSMADKAINLGVAGIKKKQFGESSKYVKLGAVDEDGEVTFDNLTSFINQDKLSEDIKFAGYNMLITSEINMKSQDIHKAYKNLWRIEETFRLLKNDLQIRPVYLQKKERIYGHFLIGYIASFILRYLELVTFEDKVPLNQVVKFIRNFMGIESEKSFINITKRNMINPFIEEKLDLPLSYKVLSLAQLKKIMNYKI
jgi:transposase